jgi:hypothetical protein
VDFIDEAIGKLRIRLGADKQKIETEEAEKRDQEIRGQVDQFISKIVIPVVINAKRKFEKEGINAEVDIETSKYFEAEKSYYKGVKLQLKKGLDRKTVFPIVTGPSLSFSASPPYSTAMAIVAYGVHNDAIFSERFDITEMTEKLVLAYLKRFIDEVIK